MNRQLISLVAVCLFLSSAVVSHAQTQPRNNSWQQRGRQPAANRNLPPSKQSEQLAAQQAAAANQAAAREEARVVGQARWLEQQLQREQQLLESRMKQAEQIRQQGLQKEDSKRLRQAEQIERAAVTHYEQRLKQLENAQIGAKTQSNHVPRKQSVAAPKPNTNQGNSGRNWRSR